MVIKLWQIATTRGNYDEKHIRHSVTLIHTDINFRVTDSIAKFLFAKTCVDITINSVVGASLKKPCTPNEIYTFGIMHKSFL